MKIVMKLIALSAGLPLLGGCSTETVYTLIQQENGLMMKAPIKFTVRVRVNKLNKTVTWLQDAVDANGFSDRKITTYGKSSTSNCQIFDDENWICEIKLNGKTLDRPEMKNGNLSRFYFIKTENYNKRYQLFGYAF